MVNLQQPVPFNIDPNELATDSSPSDRFVYSPWFVVYDPFLDGPSSYLPSYQLDRMALVLRRDSGAAVERLQHRFTGLSERISALTSLISSIDRSDVDAQRKAKGGAAGLGDLKGLAESVRQMGQKVSLAARSGEVSNQAADALSLALSTAAALADNAGLTQRRPETVSSTNVGITVGNYGPLMTPDLGIVAACGLAMSDLGFLFLDRTRIRPTGFTLGEHIQSFSLAPGEEVTLEVKTYSKKEESFEKSSEQEKTFDTELSSTLTTELNEGITSEFSKNDTNTNTLGANVGGNIDGITFNVGPTSSSNVANASRDTATQSSKSAQTASSKVAARNRALHKIVYRITTETRFESTSKRVFRNPNANTPIDLQYFKVLQKVTLSHERYGLRLCWAPVVADPGQALIDRLAPVKAAIYAKAAAATAGPPPPEPVAAGSTPPPAPQSVSEMILADQFDPVWGGQRHDYQIDIPAPLGLTWDRVTPTLAFTFTGSRPAGASLISSAATAVGVQVVVHVGIEDNANPFKPQWWEPRGTATVTVSANFVAPTTSAAAPDPNFAAAMNAWRDAFAAWQRLDQQVKADALAAADQEWADTLKNAIDNANIMDELMGALLSSLPGLTRTVREADFLQDVFDWKNAGVRLYAAWWSGQDLRDPSRPADSFINAAWARLFLPIYVGSEARALRWIYDRVTSGFGSPATENLITIVTGQLDAYRQTNFGSVDEIVLGGGTIGDCPQVTRPYLCLGTWDDVIPTDGTHLEVMQATSSAADDYGRELLDDAAALRAQQIDRGIRENALRQKLETDGLGQVTTDVEVNLGNDEPPSSGNP